MENLTSYQLEEALCDVRKAFRLLYFYQRRVLDLVEFVGDTLEYNYRGGSPRFSSPSPRYGKGELNCWAWDWINMYYYEFHFGSKLIVNHNITFSIFIQSDTGYFDIENNNRLSVESFAPVENTKTKLIFVVGKDGWDISKLYPEAKVFSSERTEFYDLLPNGAVMIGLSYNLSEFINEEFTRSKIEDFIEYCKAKNVIIDCQNQI
jgi:hypothetical protein